MKLLRKHLGLITVAVACAGIGAGVSAIASAGAATTASSSQGNGTGQAAHRHRRGAGIRALRRAVGGDLTVATKTGFANVSFERGTVKSVNGSQLTLAEGTPRKTYKTITLTVPPSAKVRDNGKAATLVNVIAGQRALVVQGPKVMHVIAHTPRTP